MVNLDDFLKHPKVQYIPLSVYKSIEGDWQNPFDNKNPNFFIYQNIEELSARLSHYRLPEINPKPEDMKDYVVVVALNFTVKRGFFRSLTTKFIGEKKDDHFQIFYVTKKYFPKRVLHFTLYTEEGEKLTWENVEIL